MRKYGYTSYSYSAIPSSTSEEAKKRVLMIAIAFAVLLVVVALWISKNASGNPIRGKLPPYPDVNDDNPTQGYRLTRY